MTFDNANRKNIREAEKAARLAETNRIAYTRHIMSDLFGRAWMHDLLFSCKVFHTPFVAGAPDLTAFNCGSQNIGLRLFGDVAAHCPREYALMMTEASTKEAANDRRNSESASDTNGSTTAQPGWNAAQPASTAFGVDPEGFVIDSPGAAEDTGSENTRTTEDA